MFQNSVLNLRIIVLFIVYVYHVLSDCDIRGTRRFNYVHLRHIHTKILQTRTGITNGASIVMEYLKTCQFQSVESPTAMCAYNCHTHPDCLAYEVERVHKCELCLRNEETGRNASTLHSGADMYIGIDMLEAFIDGTLITRFEHLYLKNPYLSSYIRLLNMLQSNRFNVAYGIIIGGITKI